MADEGISGLAVAFAAAGGVLAYAGFRGVGPLEALRDISGGDPPPVESRSPGLDEGRGVSGVAGQPGGRAAVVKAALKYKNDQYSQGLRARKGYSDCSSFVSKAYADVGVKPPTPNTTMGYLASPRWKTIPKRQAAAGDIAVSRSHMVLVTGPGRAIGQQNSRDDVKTGSIAGLMANSGSWVVRRYTGGVDVDSHGAGDDTVPGTGSGV